MHTSDLAILVCSTAAVTDPDLWRRSVAHWLMHGWNPTNVFGLLDLDRPHRAELAREKLRRLQTAG